MIRISFFRLLFVFVCMLMLYSCTDKKVVYECEKNYTIQSDNKEKQYANIEKVEFIQLDDSTSESMFSSISKLVIADNSIYIMDGNVSSISVFTINGRFKYKLDNIGQGPGEYIRLRDFNVSDSTLLIYDDRRRKLISYNSKNGEYIKETGTNFYARAFALLGNGNFLFVLPKDQNYSQIVITDTTFTVIKELIPFESEDPDNRSRYNLLQEIGDNIIYSKSGYNQVYVLSKKDGELLDKFQINIDGDTQDKKQLKITPFLIKNHIIGNYIDIEKENSFFYDILLAKDNHNSSYTRSFNDKSNTIFNLLYPTSIYKDSIVVSYLTAEIYEQMDHTSKLKPEDERFLFNGGFLLGLYHLKLE